MKRIYRNSRRFTFLSLVFLTLGACKDDDFLTVPLKGTVTNVVTFSSEANADLFVNDLYDQLPNVEVEAQFTDQYADNSNTGSASGIGQATVRAGAITPGNVPTGPGATNLFSWEGNYAKIRKCNVFLEQTALYKANFSDIWLKTRTAEVTFLRAYFYTLLFTTYGGIPLIAKPLNNTKDDDILYARATIDQTLAFIEADCDAAAAALPATLDKIGRATKGAALTLKGWAQLFAASPLANPTNDVTKWSKAAATHKQVMDMAVYSLFSDYGNLFLPANNFNAETIFARSYALPSKGGRIEGTRGPVKVKGVTQAWGNGQPTQSLVDDYAMANGLPITDPQSGYNPQNPYVNREPRFYKTVIYDGATWQGDVITTRIGGNNEIDLGATSDISNTAYYQRKLLDESILGQSNLALSNGTANHIIFRLGEVLLSYAEAQNEAVGPDASVYAALLLVRQRGGLPNFPAGLTKEAMRTSIRRERRIELAFEDKRWYDVRRWNITAGPTGVWNTPLFGMKIVKEASGTLSYTPVKIWNNIFYEYQNWMPIPQTVLDKNNKLVQNPGYK